MPMDPTLETVETAVFGALLFSGEPQPEILASLTGADFGTRDLGTLWSLAQSAGAGASLDPLTLRKIAADAGLPYSLADIMRWADLVGRFALWREMAAEVRRLRALRDVAQVATSLVCEAGEPAACPATVADRHAARLVDIARGVRGGALRTVGEIMPEVLVYIEARRKAAAGDAIPTGYDEIDRVSPLRPGELTILAARPSVGKSALALNMAANIARAGWGAAIVSLEMTAWGLVRRLLQSEAAVSLSSVHPTSDLAEYHRLVSTAQTLGTLPVVLAQPGRLTVSGLRRLARQIVGTYESKALFVDYLQLILPDQRSAARNRENEVAEVSAAAKALAVDCQVPVVMLAQLNRQAEDAKPRLSHLRDSGALEQDADVVWLLDRDRGDGQGLTSLTVAKNRDGECGVRVPLVFDAATTRFRPGGGARYAGSRAAAGQVGEVGPGGVANPGTW